MQKSVERGAMSAETLLIERGAREIVHPGGTLLAHLVRVHALLEEWEAAPAVRLAGLTHAFYGTDGFSTALGDISHRRELSAVIGEEAERLVYFYASCDRDHSHPRLAEAAGTYRDRFTGAVFTPEPGLRRDFAEITVANELDVMRASPESRARYGAGLRELFGSWKPLLSEPARSAVRHELGVRVRLVQPGPADFAAGAEGRGNIRAADVVT